MDDVKKKSIDVVNAFTLLSMPKEIIQMIFGLLDQNEALLCRLVSKQVDMDICELYRFNLTLEDERPHLQWMLQRRLGTCTIGKLSGPVRLRYPKSLNHLITTCDASEKMDKKASPISPIVLNGLLESIEATVKHLCLSFNSSVMLYNFTNAPGFRFGQLEVLNVQLHLAKYTHEPALLNREFNNAYRRIVEKSSAPELIRMKIMLDMPSSDYVGDIITAAIISLVKPRRHEMETFHLILKQVWDNGNADMTLTGVPGLNIDHFNRIKKLKILKLGLVPFMEGSSWWESLLRNQTTLERLMLVSSNMNMSNSLLLNVLAHNYQTLVSISICRLDSFASGNVKQFPIDMQQFHDCINLQTLRLVRGQGAPNAYLPDIINCQRLPNNLRRINLVGFRILTSELELVGVENLFHLETIKLEECGRSGNMGITGTIINHLMSLSSTRRLQLQGYNLSALVDREAVIMLMIRMRIYKAHVIDEIDLTRDTVSRYWRTT